MSASFDVLSTDASEALAFVAVLTVIARSNDDVIAVGETPAWLDTVCAITRLRARVATAEGVFDAIGEHTRALLVVRPDAELLEALVELGPSVVARLDAPPAVACFAIVGIAPTRLYVPAAARAQGEAITKLLATLTEPAP